MTAQNGRIQAEPDVIQALMMVCGSSMGTRTTIRDCLSHEAEFWDEVWNLAELERVTYWCLDYVRQHQDVISRQRLSSWRDDYTRQVLHSQAAFMQLNVIVRACERAGIRIIVLKGPAFLLWLHPDLGSRFFSDIDVLVREEQMSEFSLLLSQLGYVPDAKIVAHTSRWDVQLQLSLAGKQGHFPAFRRQGCLPLEPHLNILGLHGDWRLAKEEVWESLMLLDCGDTQMPCLCPDHALLHASTHYSRHMDRGPKIPMIRWLFDIALMVINKDSSDLNRVYDTAVRWGIADDFLTALADVRDAIGIDLRLPAQNLRAQQIRRLPSLADTLDCLPTMVMKTVYLKDRLLPSCTDIRQMYDLPAGMLPILRGHMKLLLQRVARIWKRKYL